MELCRRLAPLPEAAASPLAAVVVGVVVGVAAAAGPLSLLGSRIAPLLDVATVPPFVSPHCQTMHFRRTCFL